VRARGMMIFTSERVIQSNIGRVKACIESLSQYMLIDIFRIGLSAPIEKAQQNNIDVKRIFDLTERLTDILHTC